VVQKIAPRWYGQTVPSIVTAPQGFASRTLSFGAHTGEAITSAEPVQLNRLGTDPGVASVHAYARRAGSLDANSSTAMGSLQRNPACVLLTV
jgi:hypothetical protein